MVQPSACICLHLLSTLTLLVLSAVSIKHTSAVPPAAGYKQGSAPIPSPKVTKSFQEFQRRGMSDTAALQAALAWAHKQPLNSEIACLLLNCLCNIIACLALPHTTSQPGARS